MAQACAYFMVSASSLSRGTTLLTKVALLHFLGGEGAAGKNHFHEFAQAHHGGAIAIGAAAQPT